MELVPHTSEWYEAMMDFDTPKVLHTMAIVAAAGSEEVCSVCGDEPSLIVDLVGNAQAPPLRLCEDCIEIRTTMKERWVVRAIQS